MPPGVWHCLLAALMTEHSRTTHLQHRRRLTRASRCAANSCELNAPSSKLSHLTKRSPQRRQLERQSAPVGRSGPERPAPRAYEEFSLAADRYASSHPTSPRSIARTPRWRKATRQPPRLGPAAARPNPASPPPSPFHKRLTHRCPRITLSRPKQCPVVNVLRARIPPHCDLRQFHHAQGIITPAFTQRAPALSRTRISRRRD